MGPAQHCQASLLGSIPPERNWSDGVKFWVATIPGSAILTGDRALAWALFALIAVLVVTAVFSSSERLMDAAQEVLRILLGRPRG
jgi:hypothetical protein